VTSKFAWYAQTKLQERPRRADPEPQPPAEKSLPIANECLSPGPPSHSGPRSRPLTRNPRPTTTDKVFDLLDVDRRRRTAGATIAMRESRDAAASLSGLLVQKRAVKLFALGTPASRQHQVACMRRCANVGSSAVKKPLDLDAKHAKLRATKLWAKRRPLAAGPVPFPCPDPWSCC